MKIRGILAAVALSGCGVLGQDCTLRFAPAVCVTVADAKTGAWIPATVIIRDGRGELRPGPGLRETATEPVTCAAAEPCCGHVAAQPYQVEVSAEGHETRTELFIVQEDADGCHPLTRDVDVKLAPL